MFKTRVCTTALIEMMADGMITAEAVAEMCLGYMSEADVRDMMESNDLLDAEEDEEPDFPLSMEYDEGE